MLGGTPETDEDDTLADLAYSLQLLTNLGRELTGLAGAMNATSGNQWDREEVGSHRVADALDHFAGTWDDKRELLTRSLEEVGEMATSSAETFREVDDELAAKVEEILEVQA